MEERGTGNTVNVQRVFETLAKIIGEREKVIITVTVHKKDETGNEAASA